MGVPVPKCTFDPVPCNAGVPNVELTKAVANFVSPIPVNIRFLPVKQHAGGDIVSPLLDYLRADKAEMTPPFLAMTQNRFDEFTTAGPISSFRMVYIYRQLNDSTPTLQLFSIFSWQSAALMILLTFLYVIFSRVVKAYKSRSRLFLEKVSNVSGLILSLALTILLGYVSCNVVLLFNTEGKSVPPFHDLESLTSTLESKTYRPLLASSKFFYDMIFNNSGQPGMENNSEYCSNRFY